MYIISACLALVSIAHLQFFVCIFSFFLTQLRKLFIISFTINQKANYIFPCNRRMYNMKYLFILTLLTMCFNANAQFVNITNFSGTATFSGVNVTVTFGGSVSTGGSTCLGLPLEYWPGPSGAPGWYHYSCSRPVYSVKVNAWGLNGGASGAGDYLQMEINGIPYSLTPADITSYTSCGGVGGPCYLLGGKLYGPIGTSSQANGGEIIITSCSAGINSFKVYCAGRSGVAYHIAIDTSRGTGCYSAANNGPICVGDNLNLFAIGAPTGTTYFWYGPGGYTSTSPNPVIPSATLADSGVYHVVFNVGGLLDTQATRVVIYPSPAPISGAADICVGGTLMLSDGVSGGLWSSGTPGIASVGSVSGMVTGLAVGSALITYSFGAGLCMATTTINVRPSPAAGTIIGPSSLCAGDFATYTNSALGGAWFSSTPSVATVSSLGVVSAVAAGTTVISYSVTNVCGTATTTKTITIASVAPIIGLTTLCVGVTSNLSDAIAGGAWTSSNPSVASVDAVSGAVTGNSLGTAVISYTMGGGCVATATVTINISPDAGIIFGPGNVCSGKSISLTDAAPGGIWSSSSGIATITSGGIVTGHTAGVAIISYTVTNICGTAIATKSITIDQSPTPITGVLNVCVGTFSILSDAVAGGAWTSNNPGVATIDAVTGQVAGIAVGTTIITYALPSGCFVTALVTVRVTPSAGVITGPSRVCVGSSISLTDATGTGTWSCSNGNATISSTGRLAGVATGLDTVTYTVPYTCGVVFATKVITIDPLPFAGTITGPTVVCQGSSIVLSDSIVGGSWTSASSSVSIAGGVVGGISPGAAVISYAVTNVCGTAYATKTITVKPLPDAGTITGANTVCVNATAVLSDPIPGGVWSWTNSATSVTPLGGGLSVTGVAAGYDTIKYVVTNSCGSDTASHNIIVLPLPDAGVISGADELCQGSTAFLSDSVAGGAWSSSSPGIITIDPVTGILIGSGTATKNFTVHPVPETGIITGLLTVCIGAEFTFGSTMTGGAWSSGNTSVAIIGSSSGNVSTLTVGVTVITYSVTNAYGCTNDTSLTLTVTTPSFSLSESINAIRCFGSNDGSISVDVVNATGSYLYTWSTGDSAGFIDHLVSGAYTVSVKEISTQCILTDSFYLQDPDSMLLAPSVSNDVCRSGIGSIKIAVTHGVPPYQYVWSGSAGTNELKGLHADTYTVVITDSNSCVASISVAVEDDTCNDIVIPDVITPNGDGINDVWVIDQLKYYPLNTVHLFNKWGDLLYEQQGYKNDWNGVGKNGAVLPDGTYFYLVKLNTVNAAGGSDVFTGSILIKR